AADTAGVPSSATTIAPLNVPKRPRALVTIKWRTEKLIDEWTGSMAQVPVRRSAATAAVMSISLVTGVGTRDVSPTQADLSPDLFRTAVRSSDQRNQPVDRKSR